MFGHCQNKHSCFDFGSFVAFSLFITLLFFFSPSKAQEIQDYNSCEKINGNYRNFGNSCTDQCLPQFNKYLPCVNQTKYGCDCGENNCFYQNNCVSKVEFAKTYEEILKSQQEKYSSRIDKMVELMKSDPAYSKFVHDIFASYRDSKTDEIKSEAQLMSEKFRNEATQYVQAQQQQFTEDNNNSKPEPKPEEKPVTAQVIPIATPIPQFYIDEQEKENSPQAVKLPASELDMIFPVIPLPTPAANP